MTLYQQMSISIDSFTSTAIEMERACGKQVDVVRGMIAGAEHARDLLTIEMAECEAY